MESPDIRVIVELIRAAAEWAEVVVLVTDDAAREHMTFLLKRARVSPTNTRFLVVRHDSPWIRDFGPLCVWRPGTGAAFVDFLYSQADQGSPDGRLSDDRVPLALGRRMDIRVENSPIDVEGGNFLTNGQGVAVATNALLARNAEMGLAPDAVLQHLHRNLGIEQLVVVPRMLGEPAGHVDLFATFVSPHVALVAAVDPRVDQENARRLDETARILSGIRSRGQPIVVHRLPMLYRPDGKWRSYTNVVYLNGAVLVPSYHDVDPKLEEVVAETYRRVLPGWKLIPIECTGPMNFFGALRCLTLPLPFFVEAARPGPVTDAPALSSVNPQSARQ